MKLSISKKFAKRSIKCLALFAPLAYLFGSLFFGLNGAHGGFPFSAEYQVSVDSRVVDFNQLCKGGDFTSFVDVDYTSWRTSNTLSDNVLNSSVLLDGGYWGFNYSLVENHVYIASIDLIEKNSPSIAWRIIKSNSFVSEKSIVIGYNSWRFVADRGNGIYGIYVYGSTSVIDKYMNCQLFDLTQMYGFGNEPSISVFKTDFPDSYYPYTSSSDIVLRDFSVPDNSQYLFNQFFAKDNFLVQWGENCISDNPVGFAPFGAFFKFLDENMLHLSDSQIGLMAYGYLYYCLHVLIACLAFDIVAFIPLFVQRVQDKLGGKEDD